jgi:hypothetical protein
VLLTNIIVLCTRTEKSTSRAAHTNTSSGEWPGRQDNLSDREKATFSKFSVEYLHPRRVNLDYWSPFGLTWVFLVEDGLGIGYEP